MGEYEYYMTVLKTIDNLTWNDIIDDYRSNYPYLASLTEDIRPYDTRKIVITFSKNLHMDQAIYDYDSKQIFIIHNKE